MCRVKGMKAISAVMVLAGLNGCSYYVDMPDVLSQQARSGAAAKNVCDAFKVPLTTLEEGVDYLECTREKLISKRDDVDRKRSWSNHVIGAGAAGAAVGALFNAGRSAIIGSGLGAGAGLAYGKAVNFLAYEATYNAGIMALDCLAGDSTKVLTTYRGSKAKLDGLADSNKLKAEMDENPQSTAAALQKELSYRVLSKRADARASAFAESMRQRANEIIIAVNEQIREDLPKPEVVLAAFGGLAGNLNSLPKPRNEPTYAEPPPGMNNTEVIQHEAALKSAIDDASDGVCPALEPFAINQHSVRLKFGQVETLAVSVPVSGGWVGDAPKGVEWSPQGTGLVNGVSNTTRGFRMSANGSDIAPGTYYFTVVSMDPMKPGSINVKVRIPSQEEGGVCAVPPMAKGKARPKAPKGIKAGEPAAALNVDQVLYVQGKLKVAVDGDFGAATRNAFVAAGLDVDTDGNPTQAGVAGILAGCSNLALK
jgi:hypothetical protein